MQISSVLIFWRSIVNKKCQQQQQQSKNFFRILLFYITLFNYKHDVDKNKVEGVLI